MLRRSAGLLLVVVLVAGGAPGLAAPAEAPARIAPRPLASALAALEAGRWARAAALAARDGPAAADLVEWHRLRAGRGTVAEVLAFLRANGHWPGLARLRRVGAAKLAGAAPADVLAFYKGMRPQTGFGALTLARALRATGRPGDADATLVLAWRTLNLTPDEHRAFIAQHGALLAPHHTARLAAALWEGWDDLDLLLPRVPAPLRTQAEARRRISALARKRAGVPAVEAVLAPLDAKARADPGIAFALFDHAIRTDAPERATSILLRQSRAAQGLGRPQAWAGWRRYLARAAMRAGDAERAYDIATPHGLTEGAAFADLEWLAGYLALRKLDDPERALAHFRRMRDAVQTPISLGRAGYWIGRALDALGEVRAARAAYLRGAEHGTSFYGLLAAGRAKLGGEMVPAETSPQEAPDWRQAEFARSDLLEVVRLMRATGNRWRARQFLLHLARDADAPTLRAMAAMLAEWGDAWLQVEFGKAAAARGVVLAGPYFPLHPLVGMDLPVPAELVLTIARRESEFAADVVSPAGALGLMQLMPATAQEMARSTGLPDDPRRLREDWRLNVALGAAYLADLARRYDGNVLLMAAGYNAGPGRVAGWIDEMGDPRRRDAAGVVDWIEHIPFRETRNYVMRVAESLPVYRARLGREAVPQSFSEEIRGSSIAAAPGE